MNFLCKYLFEKSPNFYNAFTNTTFGPNFYIYKEEKQMGKFSTGLFAGALIGMGMGMIDKKMLKRAKKSAKHLMCEMSHFRI